MTGLLATKPRAADVPALAEAALWHELNLTPKPGLVDRANSGSHRDMDYALFTRSIAAITPWFRRFEAAGFAYAHFPVSEQLRRLRPFGIACEQAMLAATNGVNTHKGGIFALGLLCFAAGRLCGQARRLSADALCQAVSEMCRGMVQRELAGKSVATTAGERQFQQYGLTGARGEAESGFAMARSVPGVSLHERLLRLMAVNPDSNLVSRGGIEGLHYVQRYAQRLLKEGWDLAALEAMNRALVERNLSPGGSADLLSVAWVLGEI